MLRSIDEAQRRGDLPDFAAGLARELVKRVPIDQLIRGGLSLRGLLGQ
jgi:hypothetical protein